MIKILNKPEEYIMELPTGESFAYIKNDISESVNLLNMLIFTMGLNTDGKKLHVLVKKG